MISDCVKNGWKQGLTNEALVKKKFFQNFFLAATPGLWLLRARRISLCCIWRKT